MTRRAANPFRTRRLRILRDERGVTMVLFGLIIVALLAIVAIVVDLGNARQQKRQLQNAADAAALAGASAINGTAPTCVGGDQANDALKYAYNNLSFGTAPSCPTSGLNYTVGNTTVTITTPYSGGPTVFDPTSKVNVKICRDVGTTFARVINVTSVHVCSNATARKAGVGSSGNPGGGTNGGDPDAPCTEDNFIPTKYTPGGSPGGTVHDGNTVGAMFGVTPVSDAATLDLVNHPPTFTLNGVAVSPSSTNPIKINGHAYTGPGFVLPAPMGNVTVNGVTYHNVYSIQWKISDPTTGSALANNAQYSVSMSAYDTDQDNSPAGDCGKAQWSFVKGTLPSGSGTSPCIPGASGTVEDSFLGSIFPKPGVTVHKGDLVGATFQDESIIFNGTTDHAIVFQLDGADLAQGTPAADSVQGPNTAEAPGSTSAVYTLRSPTSLITTKEKYSTDIEYKLPGNLSPGTHTVTLKAWDTDSNKAGGDCGVATWTINLAGSDVELVQ